MKQIASNYAPGSEEKETLELAGLTMLFALVERPNEFEGYKDRMVAPLTDEERRNLKRLGLDKSED